MRQGVNNDDSAFRWARASSYLCLGRAALSAEPLTKFAAYGSYVRWGLKLHTAADDAAVASSHTPFTATRSSSQVSKKFQVSMVQVKVAAGHWE